MPQSPQFKASKKCLKPHNSKYYIFEVTTYRYLQVGSSSQSKFGISIVRNNCICTSNFHFMGDDCDLELLIV